MQTEIVRVPFPLNEISSFFLWTLLRPLIGNFNKPRVNEWKLFFERDGRLEVGWVKGKEKEKERRRRVQRKNSSRCHHRVERLVYRPSAFNGMSTSCRRKFFSQPKTKASTFGVARRIIMENSATSKRNISPGCVVWARLVLRTMDR